VPAPAVHSHMLSLTGGFKFAAMPALRHSAVIALRALAASIPTGASVHCLRLVLPQ
jgi:hypothetical protein